MENKKTFQVLVLTFLLSLALVITLSSVASAITVSSLTQGKLYPGEQATISLSIKNTLNQDVEDVSMNLLLEETKFISVGGSEESIDEIREDKDKSFDFTLKASQDIAPGDYNIPYVISYTDPNPSSDGKKIEKKGSIGVTVSARTELDYIASAENPVIGQQGKVSLKIVNRGFGDVKFVSVKIKPQGFTLLSSEDVYIGNVDSDDFETATYDVLFKDQTARLKASVEYRDFDNKKLVEEIDLPLNVYTREKALELGIIQKNNTWMYGIIVVFVVIAWFVYRTIKKRMKRNKKRDDGK
ncbi:hypothetical protein J4466_00235 [Candidatus Pacearchaeota archaeon]|nr:hypothetical protein [Candidatus Pacearchaeota archaeon]